MQKSLTRLLDALKRYHPEKVILFGSAAREDADAESGLIGGVAIRR
jgi:predicted nucleotidyltransferase